MGTALLALFRAETSQLRVALTAPALGLCAITLVVFVFSEVGASIQSCAVPIVLVLVCAAVAVLLWRRPPVHPGAAAVAGVCLLGLLLIAGPMRTYGFGWLGNGNDDMANYVLSAQGLLSHGLLAPVDVRALALDHDYSTALNTLHLEGGRPGSDIMLAVTSRLAGRPPYEVFMPLILALGLCGASGVGALAMQSASRWWAAVVASALVLVSPLATYGLLQQLLGQAWGLAVAAALLALLMRPDLHAGRAARLREILPIGLLAAGLVLGYVELASLMLVAYGAYVAVLGARRELGRAALVRLWAPSVLIVAVVLNKYLVTELGFVSKQVSGGLHPLGGVPLFGYILVPSGLPSVVGLQTLPPGPAAPHLDLSIVLAALLLLGVLAACVLFALRGAAAAVVLVVCAALAVLLGSKSDDFGLFKLAMYVQPFLAAIAAIWLAAVRRRWLGAVAALALVALLATQLSTQRSYVNASRDSGNVPHLSSPDVLPAFRRLVLGTRRPIVSVTENPVLIKLEAASAGARPVYFQSRNAFAPLLKKYVSEVSSAKAQRIERLLRGGPWVERRFDLHAGGGIDAFEQETRAAASIASGGCELSLAGPREVPFNRASVPAASPALLAMPCGAPRDLLAFTTSRLGEGFYLPEVRRHVSFFQLEGDPFFPGRTMVGFGRYALFRVLGPTRGERLSVELTNTLTHDGSNLLPPAAAVGASRTPLPLVGRGSARVFSAPVEPQMIGGSPYVLIDMGVEGRLPTVSRPGLQDLYGRSVPTDPRFLTTYVRDISLLGASAYQNLKAPQAIARFPRDLGDPGLEYSGIYEDGWVGSDSFVRLSAGPSGRLVVRGMIPAGAGNRLEVLVNGRRMAAASARPGLLNLQVELPRSAADRRVELRFGTTIRLAAPDFRPAAAHLSFIGVVPAGRG
ncbi:MAG: hypothetical protein ACYDC2_07750 [Solirubrobacteraceae bacterium]